MLKLLFSDPLSIVFNIIIILSGLFVFIRLIMVKNKFNEHEKKYQNESKKRRDDPSVEINTESGTVVSDNYKGITDAFMEDYQEEYEVLESDYKFWSQFVSVFPMMGILGTVVGLMMQVSSEGLEQMTSSIGLALGTTFMGLSAALILKITDNIVGTSADKIVTIITKYDRKYHHATTKAQLEKGK